MPNIGFERGEQVMSHHASGPTYAKENGWMLSTSSRKPISPRLNCGLIPFLIAKTAHEIDS
jgi:hypothetical protein